MLQNAFGQGDFRAILRIEFVHVMNLLELDGVDLHDLEIEGLEGFLPPTQT